MKRIIRHIASFSSPLHNTYFCNSSKKELKRQIKLSKKLRSQVAHSQEPKYEKKSLFTQKPFAVRYPIPYQAQLASLGILLMPALFFINNPINEIFYLSLFAGQKLSAMILLANFNWSNFKLVNILVFGSIVGLQILVPINQVSGILVEIYELMLFFTFNSKLQQGQQLTDEQKKAIYNNLIVRIGILMALSAICFAKIAYYYECTKMENIIQEYQNKNSQLFKQQQ